MAFQIGCAKKNSAGKVRQARGDKAQAAASSSAHSTGDAESKTKSSAEADVVPSEKPNAKVPAVAAKPESKPEVKPAKNPLIVQSPPATAQDPQPSKPELSQAAAAEQKEQPAEIKKPVDQSTDTTIATDSEKIKTQDGFKIAFRNLDAIKRLSENKKLVIMRQKEVELTSPQTLLGQLNEEQFCQIQLDGKFHPQDFLLLDLDSAKNEQIDKELDLYRTQMQFKNSNGVATIVCDHTTNNFYFEDMYQNLGQLIVVYGLENQVLDLKNFVNPRTERRKINAIKLKDIEKLKQIVISADTKEGLGIASGVVDSSDKLINYVAAGAKEATCVITDKLGDFKTDRVYIRVDKGILVDTPKNIPSATLFSVYRADSEHVFELSCFMKKSAEWNVLFDAMKGVIEFGVLDRPVYNKTFDEIKALHNKKQ